MKTLFVILLAFTPICALSQSLEERQKITAEFEKVADSKIELHTLNSKEYDAIHLNSEFLKKNNIKYKVLGFRISGLDKDGKTLFFVTSTKNHMVPKAFNEKVKRCSECQKVKVDLVTISWFTGTYTLKTSQIWTLP